MVEQLGHTKMQCRFNFKFGANVINSDTIFMDMNIAWKTIYTQFHIFNHTKKNQSMFRRTNKKKTGQTGLTYRISIYEYHKPQIEELLIIIFGWPKSTFHRNCIFFHFTMKKKKFKCKFWCAWANMSPCQCHLHQWARRNVQ